MTLTPDEEWEMRANADVIQPDHPCRNCGQSLEYHVLAAANRCWKFEPATRDDLEEESE
jgi:hypothetical protein